MKRYICLLQTFFQELTLQVRCLCTYETSFKFC